MVKRNGTAVVEERETPSNDAEDIISTGEPYVARVTIKGVCPIFFHRYSVEAVKAKGAAAKNSVAKKTDDLESYTYRNEDGELCIEGVALRAALVHAGKSRQDPRSPRKSASDLYKAIIVPITDMASLGKHTKRREGNPGWDYVDARRAVVQRNAVPRERPAMRAGWQATFDLQVQAPEYLAPDSLNELIQQAGRLSGLLDYRPTFGRFQVVSFKVVTD